MLNLEQLKQLHIAEQWLDPLNSTFGRFDISTPIRQACFIGQVAHESGGFKFLVENLNYKKEALQKIWPKRFDAAKAEACQRNPRMIANVVYSGRMGNRDEASDDGWRFRGRGCIQLTGHANYFHAGQALGVDFVMEPDLVATPQYAMLTAGWFWDTHKLNQFADARDYKGMTKKINGGFIGLDDRVKHIEEALAILKR
jgi:putative chitinase